jgi:hypothetical protein
MASANLGGSLTRRRLAAQMSALTGTLVAQGNLGIGRTFYVNSSSALASASNTGLDVQRPLTTIALALALCTANVGDTIVCGPGHTESITAAAALTINKAGVTIVGKGNGSLQPTLTWSASTAAQVIVSAANVTWRGFKFDFTGIDAVVAAISVTGAGVAFEDCEFVTNSATTGVVLGILTAATATRFRVERCNFTGPATNSGTTTTACIKHEVGEDYIIRNNYFTGKMTQAILNATALLRGLIDSNRFVIATGTKAITMHASSTPFIVNNRMNVASGTAPITAAAGFVSGNNYSAAAGVTAGTASTI